MTIDHDDVGDWFSFTPGATNYPTEAQCDAYVAAAQTAFKARTKVTFDETEESHIMVLQYYIERSIKAFFKMKTNMAESYSMQGGSVSHQFQPLLYSRDEIESLIADIRNDAAGPAMAIYDSGGSWD